MNRRKLMTMCMIAMTAISATAQEYYDLTEYYLKNSLFDTNFNYTASQTGNVAQELLEIDGWTAAHTADYTISGIYQIGTKKTFNGARVPATNVNGTNEGGVLALSTGWEKSLIFIQTINLPSGVYKLVSAYYNGDASKTDGKSLLSWIPTTGTTVSSKVASFPVGEWVTDTLTFSLTSARTGKIQIGFKAAADGSGNSAKISVDYVKLLRTTPFGDKDLDNYKSKLKTLLNTANSQYGTGTKRGSAALKTAIDEAQAVIDNSTATFAQIDAVYEKLNEALNVFKALQTADTALKNLLATANKKADAAAEGEATELKQAIADAQAVYDNPDATVEQLQAATTALQTAVDTYNYSHPTGAIPTVKTDPRFARGATMAFGRLTVTTNGATIKERGFCWSENPDPTISDNKSTKTLQGSTSSGVNGTIYWLQDLKPATKYYMRAYAVTTGYQVAYGDQIKFYTIPKGTIRLTVRDGGDVATYNRIKKASEDAVDYWNNLTEMKGFAPSVGFVEGTPTADCSYGGWVRVGSNTSYQRTGTILHEFLHGVGVIPSADTEWSRHTLRAGVNGDGIGTGAWLGDRTTEVVRFLQNSTTAQLSGDYQHMWPFGINGAHEDSGEEVLYIANGLTCQALGEDGLQHTSSLFAEPYYALDQEDDIKFYIKNESTNRGLYTSYLVPNSDGTLNWREMTTTEAAGNDSVAWYITFTPNNQYYQFRNAATGQYLTYGSGVKTATKTTLTANENWHLMKGRVDVDGQRGYWVIHPTSNWTPACMQANVNGAVGTATFNIANSAETQRWLIMTLDEAQASESKALAKMKTQVTNMLAKIQALADVPHKEDVSGCDQAFSAALTTLNSRAQAATTTTELTAITNEAQAAANTFLESVTVTDVTKPFDLTYKMVNPSLSNGNEGWSQDATFNYGCAEFYQTTFDFNQTVTQLPAGTYQFCANAFQRPGATATAYTAYSNGRNNVNATIYTGTKYQKIRHICDDMQTTKLGTGNESTLANGKFVPNDMQSGSAYFAKGLYENRLTTTVSESNSSLKMGIRSTSMPTSYWAMFDNFRLFFYGRLSEEVLGVQSVTNNVQTDRKDIYTLDGRRLSPDAQLRPGLYIVNGRKVVVK